MRPVLPLVAVAALAAAAPGPPLEGDMLRVDIAAILPVEDRAALLLLQSSSGVVLPLVIGLPEASAIEAGRGGVAPPRPLTHDLLASAVAAMGGKVARVEIDGFEASVFHAKVRISLSGRMVTLDARPSDSVALAVRTGAPIYAARKVLDGQGLSRADIDRLRKNPPDLEQRLRGEDPGGTRL